MPLQGFRCFRGDQSATHSAASTCTYSMRSSLILKVTLPDPLAAQESNHWSACINLNVLLLDTTNHGFIPVDAWKLASVSTYSPGRSESQIQIVLTQPLALPSEASVAHSRHSVLVRVVVTSLLMHPKTEASLSSSHS